MFLNKENKRRIGLLLGMAGPVYCRRRAQPETPRRGHSDHDPEPGHVREGPEEGECQRGLKVKDLIAKMDGLYRKE